MEGVCEWLRRGWLVCLHLGPDIERLGSVEGGGFAHGNQATNKQADEQMKMEEWRLKDEDGWMHERENQQTSPFFFALTTGRRVL